MGGLRVQSLPCMLVNTLSTQLTMPRTAYLQVAPLSIQSQGFLASRTNLEILPAPYCGGRRSGASPTETRARAKETLIGIMIREMEFQARTKGSALPYVQTFELPHNR